MKRLIPSLLLALCTLSAAAQITVQVHEQAPDQPVIPAELYGQFAEHLGGCVYGGLWVGPESEIPNVDGYRSDVLEALKALKIPVLRWPGGCFADEYHWMDGIGPREQRPQLVNLTWGGTLEDNSFGTHEFLNLCELLGAQPYLSGNVGSGTVEELSKWMEYVTAPKGPMAELRARNGRKEPWDLRFVGIGNESWGCGGHMTAGYYADLFRRYGRYARGYGKHQSLFQIACGPNEGDYEWTRTLMKYAGTLMKGLSVHYYTVLDWNAKGSATAFTPEEYYRTLTRAAGMEAILRGHIAIMDEYDPEQRVALVLDEWGTWYDPEPGSDGRILFQQATMRDAMVAAIGLNLFPRFLPRLKMCNIAQVANVLQAMVLTDGPEMVLTPTYHVFRMFQVHQGAQYVPVDVSCGTIVSSDGREMPAFSVSASRALDGMLHISMANPYLDRAVDVTLALDAMYPDGVTGEILRADDIHSYNEFGKEPAVAPVPFRDIHISGKTLSLTLPAASVVMLNVQEAPAFICPQERKPQWNGGTAIDFQQWVIAHQQYPEEALKAGIEGRVVVSFVITAEGKLTDVKVRRGAHPLLDGEAVRVIESAPQQWTPGARIDGTPVDVTYLFPVIFKLPE